MADLFFGLQLAVQSPADDAWRARLRSLVRAHTKDLGHADKRGMWGAFANLVLDAERRWRLGFWDFVPDGRGEYDDWVRGIEDDSAEPWVADDSGARNEFVLVSAMFLLPANGFAAELVGARCDLDEAVWRTHDTWRHLVGTLPMLDVASVRGDALYLTPGGARQAFSLRELQGDGYDYLLPIE